MKQKRLPPLRAALFWLVTVCLLPAILIAGGMIWRELGQRQAESSSASISQSRALSAKVDREFADVQSTLLALGTSPLLATPNLAAFHAQSKTVEALTQIDDITLFDAAGRQLLHTASPYGTLLPPHANSAQLERVLKTGNSDISNLFTAPIRKKLVVSVAVPVKTGDTVSHILVANLMPDYFQKVLADVPLAPGHIIAVFDGASAVVAVRGVPGDTDKLTGRPVNPGLAGALQRADEGAVNTINLQGTEVLNAFSRSAKSRWGAAIAIPREELLAPLRRSLLLLVGAPC